MSLNARESSWRFERNKILQQMAENYKDAMVRHQDPMYITKHVETNPEAGGRNFLSTICCNYYFIIAGGQSFLNTTSSVQSLANLGGDCVKQGRYV